MALPQHRLKVETEGLHGGRVHLDGEDISGVVQGVTLDVRVGEFTRAELDIVALDATWEGEADIHLPQGTKDLLVRFGWTPPAEEAK